MSNEAINLMNYEAYARVILAPQGWRVMDASSHGIHEIETVIAFGIPKASLDAVPITATGPKKLDLVGRDAEGCAFYDRDRGNFLIGPQGEIYNEVLSPRWNSTDEVIAHLKEVAALNGPLTEDEAYWEHMASRTCTN